MVILYEIVLVLGVWIFKIKNLEDDIVLSFLVLGIWIIVLIFGWGMIGIEVFNKKFQMVFMWEVLLFDKFK